MAPRSDRRRRDRGSTLLLFPAALLIVLGLGAVAADTAILFLGERELANATAAAANDAATEALANASFYRHGRLEVADAGARQIASDLVRTALSSSRYRNVDVAVEVLGDRVIVRAQAEVRRLFAAAMPGGLRWAAVGATTTVRANERAPMAGP